jgi:hypothetical protein
VAAVAVSPSLSSRCCDKSYYTHNNFRTSLPASAAAAFFATPRQEELGEEERKKEVADLAVAAMVISLTLTLT